MLTITAIDKVFALYRPIWYKYNATPKLALNVTIGLFIILSFLIIIIFIEYHLQDGVCNLMHNDWSLIPEKSGKVKLIAFDLFT